MVSSFLAHLSWKLKSVSCLIRWHSAFVCSSVPSSVNFLHFRLFFRTTGPISTKLGTTLPWVKETQGFTNKDHSILKKEIMGCFLSQLILCYNHSYSQLCFLISKCFSGERFGPWASCLDYEMIWSICLLCIIIIWCYIANFQVRSLSA